MGWAEEQAQKIARAEELVRKDREWQLHVANTVRAEAPGLFERLAEYIASHVAEFNAARGSDDVKCERPSGRIEISKPQPFPSMLVRLIFNEAAPSITVFKSTVRSEMEQATEAESIIRFSLKDGSVLLDGKGTDETARTLLEAVFDCFLPRS